MFEVQPLTNLSPAPENDYRSRGLPGHAPILGPDGAFFGHEWSLWRYDTLDVCVDAMVRDAPRPMRLLDLGCASGSRATDFARRGCLVTAVDILDRSAAIAARTADLSRDTTSGGIVFEQADLRTWPDRPRRPFRLIHARRVINFMTSEEAGRLFGRLRPLLERDGSLVLSFIHAGLADAAAMAAPGPGIGSVQLARGFYGHDFREIVARLQASGFVVRQAFSDGQCDVACLAEAA